MSMNQAQAFYHLKQGKTAYEHYWKTPRTPVSGQPLKRFNVLVTWQMSNHSRRFQNAGDSWNVKGNAPFKKELFK